jgi:hypothetical protein
VSSDISEPVQRFVAAHISSIELLEVLLLLRRTASRDWTAAEVAREIGSSVMSIQDRLGILAAQGFLAARESGDELRYRYAPSSEESARIIDDLARAYKERRLRVIGLIYEKPPPSDIQSFSDAFRIKSKKEEG